MSIVLLGDDSRAEGDNVDRIVRMRNTILRGKCFIMRDEADVFDVFSKIKRYTVTEHRSSISWYRGKSVSHLGFDYSGSDFLTRMGVGVRDQFAMATVCTDLLLLVELCVAGTDGHIYESNECRSSSLRDLPLPDEIAAKCLEIRAKKPLNSFSDSWVGFEGLGIREWRATDMQEDFDVGFEQE